MDTITKILNAKSGRELFYPDDTKAYQKLAREVHPDSYRGPDSKSANDAFARLTRLWNDYKSSKTPSDVIKTSIREYKIVRLLQDNGVQERIAVTYDNGNNQAFVVIAKTPGDNDLMRRYASVASMLRDSVEPEYKDFFPRFIETLTLGSGSDARAGLVYSFPIEGFYSLREVAEDYPEGINGRDAVWIFKRILVALGNVHDIETIHGAVNLDSVFIHPAEHGLVLDNWAYSVDAGEYLRALPPGTADDYPESVFRREAPDKELDIRLAAKVMLKIMEGKPRELRRFFNAIVDADNLPHPAEVLAIFNKVTEEVYGPPKFHVFKMRRTG